MNWDTLELFKLRAFHNQVNPCITSAHYLEAHDVDPLDQEILIDFEENEDCIPISAQVILHKIEPSGSRIDQAKHQPEEEKLESLIFNGSKESDSQFKKSRKGFFKRSVQPETNPQTSQLNETEILASEVFQGSTESVSRIPQDYDSPPVMPEKSMSRKSSGSNLERKLNTSSPESVAQEQFKTSENQQKELTSPVSAIWEQLSSILSSSCVDNLPDLSHHLASKNTAPWQEPAPELSNLSFLAGLVKMPQTLSDPCLNPITPSPASILLTNLLSCSPIKLNTPKGISLPTLTSGQDLMSNDYFSPMSVEDVVLQLFSTKPTIRGDLRALWTAVKQVYDHTVGLLVPGIAERAFLAALHSHRDVLEPLEALIHQAVTLLCLLVSCPQSFVQEEFVMNKLLKTWQELDSVTSSKSEFPKNQIWSSNLEQQTKSYKHQILIILGGYFKKMKDNPSNSPKPNVVAYFVYRVLLLQQYIESSPLEQVARCLQELNHLNQQVSESDSPAVELLRERLRELKMRYTVMKQQEGREKETHRPGQGQGEQGSEQKGESPQQPQRQGGGVFGLMKRLFE